MSIGLAGELTLGICVSLPPWHWDYNHTAPFMPAFFTWVLEIKLGSSCLDSKHLTGSSSHPNYTLVTIKYNKAKEITQNKSLIMKQMFL